MDKYFHPPQSDGLVISNVDKLQHYMLQMWDCSLFDQLTITEWTIKPSDEKTYANAVFSSTRRHATSKRTRQQAETRTTLKQQTQLSKKLNYSTPRRLPTKQQLQHSCNVTRNMRWQCEASKQIQTTVQGNYAAT